MSQQRRMFDHDLTYSEWHRHKGMDTPSLPRSCYMFDIDAMEVRSVDRLRPVALIECKHAKFRSWDRAEFQMDCMKAIARSADVPALVVQYHPCGPKQVVGEVFIYDHIGRFTVTNLATGERRTMSERDFRGFIEALPHSVARLPTIPQEEFAQTAPDGAPPRGQHRLLEP